MGQKSPKATMRVGARLPPGRALLPRGRLVEFQTSTPSLLDCICSKKDHREGFIRLDSVWYSFSAKPKNKEKQKLALGSRLIG